MLKIQCKSLLICLVSLLSTVSAHADWINLTGAENARNIAEIYIEKDHVRVKLEIFVEDLLVFEELVPDDFFPEPIPGRPGPEERIRIFDDQTFQVITDTEQKLPAVLDLVEPRMRVERPSPFAGSINPYTRQRIPAPPAGCTRSRGGLHRPSSPARASLAPIRFPRRWCTARRRLHPPSPSEDHAAR